MDGLGDMLTYEFNCSDDIQRLQQLSVDSAVKSWEANEAGHMSRTPLWPY